MSKLLTKSKENLLSADILISNKHFCSSVHCSYYGVFQLMAYILQNKLGLSQVYLNELLGKDSHKKVINEIFEAVREKDKSKSSDFNRMIGNIKSYRQKADYEEVAIPPDQSIHVLKTSVNLSILLKTVFQIS